jgi:hypothetical protein
VSEMSTNRTSRTESDVEAEHDMLSIETLKVNFYVCCNENQSYWLVKLVCGCAILHVLGEVCISVAIRQYWLQYSYISLGWNYHDFHTLWLESDFFFFFFGCT